MRGVFACCNTRSFKGTALAFCDLAMTLFVLCTVNYYVLLHDSNMPFEIIQDLGSVEWESLHQHPLSYVDFCCYDT